MGVGQTNERGAISCTFLTDVREKKNEEQEGEREAECLEGRERPIDANELGHSRWKGLLLARRHWEKRLIITRDK